MRIIKLKEIRLLKQSEKSTVLLVREMDGEQLFVKKILQGRHEIYRTLQSCPHPYLPKIYEAEISDDTTVVLEGYIDGQTLDSVTLTEKQACNIIKGLCVVLEFLHEKGIIHRDVKPSNIIFAKDGHIRLIDFDAAWMIKGDSVQDTRLLGTRGYAPPEQFGFAQTDTRTDIYALGMTMEQRLGAKAKKCKYQRIIRKCKMLDPDRRYQSVKDVRKALSFYRRAAPWFFAATVVALLLFVMPHMFQNPYDARKDRESYPDESLLFYAKNGEYIIANSDISADANEDGIYELFVSQGDRQHTLYTTVWRLADIENKRYEFAEEMRGTSAMYLHSSGDIRAIVSGDQLNHYNYADGTIKMISGVDFEAFKNSQATEVAGRMRTDGELASSIQGYYNNHFNYDNWTYENIVLGYRLDKVESEKAHEK